MVASGIWLQAVLGVKRYVVASAAANAAVLPQVRSSRLAHGHGLTAGVQVQMGEIS